MDHHADPLYLFLFSPTYKAYPLIHSIVRFSTLNANSFCPSHQIKLPPIFPLEMPSSCHCRDLSFDLSWATDCFECTEWNTISWGRLLAKQSDLLFWWWYKLNDLDDEENSLSSKPPVVCAKRLPMTDPTLLMIFHYRTFWFMLFCWQS